MGHARGKKEGKDLTVGYVCVYVCKHVCICVSVFNHICGYGLQGIHLKDYYQYMSLCNVTQNNLIIIFLSFFCLLKRPQGMFAWKDHFEVETGKKIKEVRSC